MVGYTSLWDEVSQKIMGKNCGNRVFFSLVISILTKNAGMEAFATIQSFQDSESEGFQKYCGEKERMLLWNMFFAKYFQFYSLDTKWHICILVQIESVCR